ncbi:LysM peptidoglycan-binding domain-containing protein [Kribbella sp. NPDC051936]|uniref:LysM peptidoglycan-binding domain-containing protein n=1 Tax=Kribbella sp. NPDC051936 TaxID=3154946 RepID=UPI00341DF080
MNAMIRVVKGTLAIVALAGVGLLLRWITAGSITGLRTYDLDSLTVLAVGTIAWIAYGWLVLAVLLTVLEQIPGTIGTLSGAVAGRITTKTARTLLRSGLGVAAVTPLTVGVAQAAPNDTAHVHQWTQPAANFRTTESASSVHLGPDTSTHRTSADNDRATEPRSTVELGSSGQANTDYRATERASTVQLGPDTNTHHTNTGSTAADQATDNYRATEPASTVQLGADAGTHRTSTSNTTADDSADDFRATEPRSTVELGSSDQAHTDRHATEPPSGVRLSSTPTPPDDPTPNRPVDPGNSSSTTQKPGRTERPTGGSRVGVPDRPADGAPTRYTELRPTVPVRVVVREGDSLWKLAARELGPDATAEAIAARWPAWYAANRHVIGNDPDLIYPGQVLRIPPTPTGDHLPPHHQEQ